MNALAGLWRRELLIDADGGRDDTTDVYWLQGLSYYVDLRVPAGRPGAAVEGFAGTLTERMGRHHWLRLIDLHPPGPHPDVGTLSWQGELLIETGWHAPYVERWRRDGGSVPDCWGLQLRHPDGRDGLVVRVDRRFGTAIGTAGTAIGTAGTAGTAADDSPGAVTEISIGTVVDRRWQITASSAPGRIGESGATVAGLVGAGWSVLASEGPPPEFEVAALRA